MTRLMHYLSKSQKRNGNQLLSSWDSKIKCGTDCANKKGLYIKEGTKNEGKRHRLGNGNYGVINVVHK